MARDAPIHGLAADGAPEAAFYDDGFSQPETAYRLPWSGSPYIPLWERVLERLLDHQAQSILDIGCGPGQFAAFLRHHAPQLHYRGFDFSPVAVELAREQAPDAAIAMGDVRDPDAYRGRYDAATVIELLEHVDDDFSVLTALPMGTRLVFSVPNYDSLGHVRFFPNASAVHARYRTLLADFAVERLLADAETGKCWWVGTGRVTHTWPG